MEKVLSFLAAAALTVPLASAQLPVSAPQQVAGVMTCEIPAPRHETAMMRQPGTPMPSSPKQAVGNRVFYYNRPAGMYPGSLFISPDDSYGGMALAPYYATKPYAPYTFTAICNDVMPDTAYEWDIDIPGTDRYEILYGQSITQTYGVGVYTFPKLWLQEGDEWNGYVFPGLYRLQSAPKIMSSPSASNLFADIDEGGTILVCSKSFYFDNEFGSNVFTYDSGMDPYGDNARGWWFGKNGGTMTNSTTGVVRTLRIDGIAQAYEKPSHPYLLKRVVVDAGIVNVVDKVDMTCKIYKLDSIPAYLDDDVASLPEVPGELIAYGRATLTPEMYPTPEDGGLIIFNLYDEEYGLEIEYTPTIDSGILVVIDGYNDPDMENLQDFTAMVFSNIHQDEGFGELAYLKYGLNDDDGNFTGDYKWVGLNNFFSSGEMKTGLSIFLDMENPYLAFYYDWEDGEYLFPSSGGVMRKPIVVDGQSITASGIEFNSWVPSADEGWEMTCNGEEVPDWLSIELTDGEKNGEFNHLVNAQVVAEPLPKGVTYREAVVRFSFAGAYLDYKFMQSYEAYFVFDMNGDGEVNLADLNALIDAILDGADLNIGDVNILIDYILSHR